MKLGSRVTFEHEMFATVFLCIQVKLQAEHITVIHENMQIAWFSYYTQIISQSFFAIYGIFLFKVGRSKVSKWAVWFVKAPLASKF